MCFSEDFLSLYYLGFVDLYRGVDFHMFHQVWGVWGHYIFKYSFVLSCPSGIPIVHMLIHLMVSCRFLSLSPFFLILFYLSAPQTG